MILPPVKNQSLAALAIQSGLVHPDAQTAEGPRPFADLFPCVLSDILPPEVSKKRRAFFFQAKAPVAKIMMFLAYKTVG